MLEQDPQFRPVQKRGGHLPIEDLGLIGDGATAALVGRDGSIQWLCLRHFDSEPLFCGLLDPARGGHFSVTPEGLRVSRQYYEPDTGVLVTELQTDTGTVRLTDALALRSNADLADDSGSDRRELIRSALVLDGNVRLGIDLEPRNGANMRPAFDGIEIQPTGRPDLRLHLRSNRPLSGLTTTHDLAQGDRIDLVLSWGRFHRHHALDVDAMLRDTADAWRRWMSTFAYSGALEPMVRRSAITLKLCDQWVSGSLVAAPTSSLPAPVGGVRNWDYRYSWIRDAAYGVFALRRVGFANEADAFLGWVLDAFERSRWPRIMYTFDGGIVPEEREDTELDGYRGSRPVRWGNGAADQRQHDVYGEVLGKALGTDRKEVTVHFRAVPHGGIFDVDAAPNVLRFGLDPEDVRLELAGVGSHARGLVPVTLAAQLEPARLPPYGQLLHNVLHRNMALSIRGDEAEESWRVVEPVLDAWSRNLVPLVSYEAGSAGPMR